MPPFSATGFTSATLDWLSLHPYVFLTVAGVACGIAAAWLGYAFQRAEQRRFIAREMAQANTPYTPALGRAAHHDNEAA